jgi:hypothetical protein
VAGSRLGSNDRAIMPGCLAPPWLLAPPGSWLPLPALRASISSARSLAVQIEACPPVVAVAVAAGGWRSAAPLRGRPPGRLAGSRRSVRLAASGFWLGSASPAANISEPAAQKTQQQQAPTQAPSTKQSKSKPVAAQSGRLAGWLGGSHRFFLASGFWLLLASCPLASASASPAAKISGPAAQSMGDGRPPLLPPGCWLLELGSRSSSWRSLREREGPFSLHSTSALAGRYIPRQPNYKFSGPARRLQLQPHRPTLATHHAQLNGLCF